MTNQTSFTSVFIDTCVFDSLQYNFSSPLLESFVSACQSAGVSLLIPDSIEREIVRHIAERSEAALDALIQARHKAPFLRKWSGFPDDAELYRGKWQVRSIALLEWDEFKKLTQSHCLDYSSLNLNEIMDWYDRGTAPFGIGKKRKEFPDAFAIASLANFAKENKKYISVVSNDKDMEGACERYSNLLFFRSLPSLTERLLTNIVNIEIFKGIIDSGRNDLELAIVGEALELEVYHRHDNITAKLVEVTACSILQSNIVAAGENECTLAFEAEIEAGIMLDVELGYWWDEFDEASQYFYIPVVVEGVAKLLLDIDSQKITSISAVSFEFGDFEAKIDLDEIF